MVKNRDLANYITESVSATRVLKLFKDRFWGSRMPEKKIRYYSVTEELNRSILIEKVQQIMIEIGYGDFNNGYNASILIACVTFLENKYIYKEDAVISKELAFIQEN